MSETKLRGDGPKRSRWSRKLAWLAGLVAVLVVAFYFIATSSAFFKGFILPKVSKSLGVDVTVADAQISPFSHVLLRDLKVQPPGGSALLTVPEIHANYSLWSVIRGNIAVSEVAIESPVVTVVENADGTCNLDALTKATSRKAKPATSAPAKNQAPAKAAQMDIKKVALNNATIRLVKNYANGGKDVTEITGLNFSISDLRNGQSGKIELAAALAVENAAQTNVAAATLQATLMGGFDFALTPDLKPASVNGSTTFTVGPATGPLADLNAVAAKLDCQLTATDLKVLSFQVTKAGAVLGEIHASGPFATAKSEGRLKVDIRGINQQVLNLAGAARGMDFGTTTIDCTNVIELTQGGSVISVAGGLSVAHLQVKLKEQISPMLDLHSEYAVTVNQPASSAVLRTLILTGTQDSRPLLQMGLSGPMTIGWDNASNAAAGDAALSLIVSNLDLADWKAVAGNAAPGGVVNLAVKLVSQQAGKHLAFEMDTHLDNLTTGLGSASVNQGNLHAQASGSVENLKRVKLDQYQLDVARQGESFVTVSGSGTFDTGTQDADLQVTVQTALAQWLAVPGASPANCAVGFKGHVTNRQNKIALTGELDLTPTGRASNTLHLDGNADISQADAITGNFKVAADSLDVTSYYDLLSSIKPAAANIQPAAASVTAASNPGQEPEAMKLPLKNFTFDLNIGHLYLREVDITNWVATALLEGGHVVLQPCLLTLNGAPVKAATDLHLDVPGYAYDVTFSADGIPLTPLVDSFAPDRKGQIAGTTSISVQVKGAGLTGVSLQKNLSGQFNFASTNLNLSLANVRSPLINSVINVIVGLPDLISNPAAALGNWFGKKKSGWADTLTSSPIDAINLQATAGDGQVQLQSAEVQSAAFQSLASGPIVLAPIFNNSTVEIPVKLLLSAPLAGQIGLADANSPTNAAYVALPEFLKIEGTVGSPKATIDKLVVVKLAAKTGGGVVKRIGGAGGQKAGSFLTAASRWFGGAKSSNTNSVPAGTNSSPASRLFKLFK
jgi:hypothetical protein